MKRNSNSTARMLKALLLLVTPAGSMKGQDAEFEEGKHPRGQPGNAGQFGPGANAIKSGAAAIKAMPTHERDNTEFQDLPGGYAANNLYEAEKLVPKPSNKLKKVTSNNTNTLFDDYHFVANVDGEMFGICKYEDPDDEDNENAFIFAFQRIDDPHSKLIETHTSDPDDLFKVLRKTLNAKAKDAAEPLSRRTEAVQIVKKLIPLLEKRRSTK